MGAKKSEATFEGTTAREQICAYLEQFAAGMRSGTVRVETGDGELELSPAAVVKLAVKAKAKHDKRSFRLELSWDDDRQGG